jgi:outer membrane protein OmpA-like peptidoglycan-associated protein
MAQHNHWISFSDIMTGLMAIFLFISISYMWELQKKQRERDKLFEEFKQTKEQLYNELEYAFEDDFKEWQVVMEKDLSIKFINHRVLFASGEINPPDSFKRILDKFLPYYFDILLQEKYQRKIYEIRIEGHTDTVPAPRFDGDPYIGNIKLSQQRSAEVLKYFRNMSYYKDLPKDKQQQLQFWITANGLSYGRTLDSNKQLSYISGKHDNNDLSRRVEFKIVTTTEKLIEDVIKDISNVPK